jgi:hypothetical protein
MPSSDNLVARTRRAVFARHAHPWSAWSRWATTPLVYVRVWNRSGRQAALVGVWMAVNPVIFGKPAHEHAWSTRAILGEERWITERPKDAAWAVNAAATLAGMVALAAARKRVLWATATATAAQMGLTMIYWEQMVRYYDGQQGAESGGFGA